MSGAYEEGATCRPNFGAAGRKRRRMVAIVGAVTAVALLGAMVALELGWAWRLLVGVPAGMALISGLQVTRNTCVKHAMSGEIEDEELRTTKADAALAEASRKVAATIWRDGLLGTVASALLAAATALWM